jgi:hypothetical protein
LGLGLGLEHPQVAAYRGAFFLAQNANIEVAFSLAIPCHRTNARVIARNADAAPLWSNLAH